MWGPGASLPGSRPALPVGVSRYTGDQPWWPDGLVYTDSGTYWATAPEPPPPDMDPWLSTPNPPADHER